MTVNDVVKIPEFEIVWQEEDRQVTSVFTCDLLSICMAKAPEDSAWVTVMGNRNVIAVASLADVSCVIAAEGCSFDEEAVEAAKGKVTLLKSPLPVFETACLVHQGLV
ncbi:MAG: hypothetical protein IKU09_09235 [Firmicutes bacterium]|nr:hypothetical protein [Bacillota bacterium]MBR4862371.1 hypothetical protein [Bacillota bacterium]